MKRITIWSVSAAAVVALAASFAMTAPKPSVSPTSWELEFTFKNPLPMRLQLPGQDKPTTYWYMRYTVTNRTENEQLFVPEVVLYTDTGQILLSGQKVPSEVFDAIAKLHKDPLLKDQASVSGKLLKGEDNAKESVAIFTDLDANCGSFDIFVGGLSGEVAVVAPPNPVPVTVIGKDGAKTVEPRDKIVLAKTLRLHFNLPGEAAARFTTPVVLDSEDWVMR